MQRLTFYHILTISNTKAITNNAATTASATRETARGGAVSVWFSCFIEFPQMGQPSIKKSSGPEKPQRGQSTELKILPQFGQRFAAADTCLPQL